LPHPTGLFSISISSQQVTNVVPLKCRLPRFAAKLYGCGTYRYYAGYSQLRAETAIWIPCKQAMTSKPVLRNFTEDYYDGSLVLSYTVG